MSAIELTAMEMHHLLQLLNEQGYRELRRDSGILWDMQDYGLAHDPLPHVRSLLSVMQKLEDNPLRQRLVTLEPVDHPI